VPRRKKTRFGVGHMALGYILGKGSTKLLKTNLNIPLVLTLSVIPDIDILLEHVDALGPILRHRGPVHSFVVSLIIFIPIFIVYRKRAVPYFIALVQHSLIGDYLTGGQLQLFWPITQQQYGMATCILSVQNIVLEWILFAASIVVLLKSRDVFVLFQPHLSNLILLVPTFTVLLPTFLSYPLGVPASLILPHLFYTIVFSASIIIELLKLLSPSRGRTQNVFQKRKRKDG
jgi:membrane-bound metal-dependent hydrolase YbcI (DUF457 family)